MSALSFNKSIKKQTVEELLAALESDIEEQSETDTSDNSPLKFISIYNIKHGKEKVRLTILCRLYKVYCSDELSATKFNDIMRLNYGDGIDKQHIFINRTELNISQELYKSFIKKYNRRYKSPTTKKYFLKFLKENNIKHGKKYIEINVLYYLWDVWNFNNKIKAHMGILTFGKYCSFTFQKKLINNVYYYAINEDAITEKQHEHIEEWKRRGKETKGLSKKES